MLLLMTSSWFTSLRDPLIPLHPSGVSSSTTNPGYMTFNLPWLSFTLCINILLICQPPPLLFQWCHWSSISTIFPQVPSKLFLQGCLSHSGGAPNKVSKVYPPSDPFLKLLFVLMPMPPWKMARPWTMVQLLLILQNIITSLINSSPCLLPHLFVASICCLSSYAKNC